MTLVSLENLTVAFDDKRVVAHPELSLASGAIKLKREEQINATAGERADISIPEEITVAMPIFKFGKAYAVKARLRYRIVEGAVKLSVLLVDPEMAIEHAFKEVVDEVTSLLEMPVYYGQV